MKKTHSIFNRFYIYCKLKHYKITFIVPILIKGLISNNIKCTRGPNGLGDLNVINKQTNKTKQNKTKQTSLIDTKMPCQL